MVPIAAGMRFRAPLRRRNDFPAGLFRTGFEVPAEVVTQLGGGHLRVVARVNGHSFRTTIARTPRGYWLGVSPWRRAAARVAEGRAHDIDVEIDPVSRA